MHEVPLKNTISRARNRFKSIGKINYSENRLASAEIAYDARRLFDTYKQIARSQGLQILPKDSERIKQMAAIIFETAKECSENANLSKPFITLEDFGENSDAKERVVITKENSHRIEVNFWFLYQNLSFFSDSSESFPLSVIRTLRELTAQEIFHIIIEK